MVNLLQISDTHGFKKLQYAKNVVRSASPDAVLLAGDILSYIELNHYAYARAESADRILEWASEDSYFLRVGVQVDYYGGIDAVRSLAKEDADFRTLLMHYERHESKIHSVMKKYRPFIDFNEKCLDNRLKEIDKQLEREKLLRCIRLDKLVGEFNCPVYAVRGNHDPDDLVNYAWKNLVFIEKNGVYDVKGIRIAGAPNTYERVSGMPDSAYDNLEKDMAFGGSSPAGAEFELWLDKYGTMEEKIMWMNHQIPPRVLNNNAVFNRLKDKKFDLLVTHKGPHLMSMEDKKSKERKSYGSGIGLEAVVSVAKPKIITGGHIHGEGLAGRLDLGGDYSYQYVKTSDNVMALMNIDSETKQIVPDGIRAFKYFEELSRAA